MFSRPCLHKANLFIAPPVYRVTAMRSSVSFLLVAILIVLSACGGLRIADSELGPRKFQPGRAFLIRDQPEEPGYGLYSYLLFDSPPTNEYRQLHLSAIKAYIREIPDIAILEKDYTRQQLNIAYIPVTKPIPQLPEGKTQSEILEWWTEWILEHYHYDRARLLLNQIHSTQREGGPYLLSTFSPATVIPPLSYLFQDLSPIQLILNPEDRPKLAFEWVLDFIDRASNPQPSAWNGNALVRFTSGLRESKRLSFSARGVRLNDSQLKRAICINFPEPDCGSKKAHRDPDFSPLAYPGLKETWYALVSLLP